MRLCDSSVWPGTVDYAAAKLRQEYDRRFAIAIEAACSQADARGEAIDAALVQRVTLSVRAELGLDDGLAPR